MALYTLAPNVKRQFLDNSGNPLASGKLYTVEAGGTYPADAVTTYQTSSGTAHTNPIILDSAGRISGSSELYFEPGQSYKLIAAASSSDYTVPLWTQDNIAAVPPSSVNVDIQGTFGENVAAGDLIYLGAAGTWLKADSRDPAKSAIPDVGFAVSTVTSGNTGTIRLSGQIELSGLTPGSKYYASATAGAITVTPPAIQRIVGTAQSTTLLEIAIQPWASPSTVPSGRLTLTTNVPVTTGDVTAAGTLYYTPYKGNKLPLYDTTLSKWYEVTYSQLSIAVPAVANQVYDVWVYLNAGTVTLELLAWTNDTTRATALVYTEGFYLKTGELTRFYLGSVRTVSASQLNDSVALRHVWNYYNRVERDMKVFESTNSWNYTTATYRQANGATANQLDFLIGVMEDKVTARVAALASNDGGSTTAGVGIGLDSTTTVSGDVQGGVFGLAGAAVPDQGAALYDGYPGIGRHTLVWLERGAGGGVTTWYGDSFSTYSFFSGIRGSVWG